MSRKLKIVTNKGTLAQTLGVSQQLSDQLDTHVMACVARNMSVMEIIVDVEANFHMNHNEWTAFMYSMGFFAARVQAAKQKEAHNG